MGIRSDHKTISSWKYRKGPGVLILLLIGLFVVTILIWRSEVPWRGLEAGVFFLGVIFFLIFGNQIRCNFNIEKQSITVAQRWIWKKSEREIRFDEAETAAVITSSASDGIRTHGVTLVLKTGERVRITPHQSSGKGAKNKLAQRIVDTLNQFRREPAEPAFTGLVNVERKGDTNGIPWTVNLISGNDSTQVTQWLCNSAKFDEGFILLIPAIGSSSSVAGELSKTTRFFYKQYLRTLMIDESQVPDFENAAQCLKEQHSLGKRFTCISNEPAAAGKWITESFTSKIDQWILNPSQKGKKADRELHVLITKKGIRLIFRQLIFEEGAFQEIVKFGLSLIEDH